MDEGDERGVVRRGVPFFARAAPARTPRLGPDDGPQRARRWQLEKPAFVRGRVLRRKLQLVGGRGPSVALREKLVPFFGFADQRVRDGTAELRDFEKLIVRVGPTKERLARVHLY